MKKRFLNKAGVTVLEGVIALGLLALVTAGAFGVLLSASRQTTQPDINEEMTWAVEKAHDLLKAYVGVANANGAPVPEELRGGLCCQQEEGCTATPLSNGTHYINCLLPPICDVNNESKFKYTVGDGSHGTKSVTFDIVCNGYQL